MKKLSVIILLAAIAAGFSFAASRSITPSKNKSTKTITMNQFDELEVSSAINVEYKQTSGNDYTVTVTAPENIMQYVGVGQHKEKVKIGINRRISINGNLEINVVVKTPVISEIEIEGASNFKASSIEMPGKKLELDASGASNIHIDKLTARVVEIDASGASNVKIKNIRATDLEADASGASTVELSGKATSVEYDASGASGIKASGLKATNGKLDASGASGIKASVKNVYERRSSGSSSIVIN